MGSKAFMRTTDDELSPSRRYAMEAARAAHAQPRTQIEKPRNYRQIVLGGSPSVQDMMAGKPLNRAELPMPTGKGAGMNRPHDSQIF